MAKKVTKSPSNKKAARPTKKTIGKTAKKSSGKALPDAEKVEQFMRSIQHPLKEEMAAVRYIIKQSNKKLSERIKWNAPSYYYKEDLVTFNAWAEKNVHLVFHHPDIVKIKSDLFRGDYTNRRMVYFENIKEVKQGKKELVRIINELVSMIDKKNG